MWSHYQETGQLLTEPSQLTTGLASNAKKLLTKKGRNEILAQSSGWTSQTLKSLERDARVARNLYANDADKEVCTQLDQIIEKAL